MEAKLYSFISLISPCLFITLVVSLCTTAVAAITHTNETDRLALLAFKNQITEDPLGLVASWNNSLHFCDWHGITCGSRHQRVVALDLRGQRLAGTISPSIGNLSFLRSIQLQDNHFRGNIPPQLSLLYRLQHLNFSGNTIQGEILANLSRCVELRVINLNINDLEGKIPASFGFLSNLTILALADNNLYGVIPPSLGNLSFLQKLSLGTNNLEGTIPDSICRIRNLKFFGIGLNKISGIVPPSLYNISSLTDLVIPANQLTGSLPSDIGFTLPNLHLVSVGGNKFTGPFPFSLSNASGMRTMDLSYNNFAGPVPVDFGRKMVDLSWLNLGSNSFGTGDASDLSFVDSLTNCTKLQVLALWENGFGGVIPISLTNLSTQLRLLDAGANELFGDIPAGISKLFNLVEFGLGNNFLSGSIPFSIGKPQNLQELYLGGNRLSGPIPASIGNLTQLFELGLEENNLTGSIPSSFENIRGLQILNLSCNSLGGSIPNTIGLFFTLTSINFAHNSFNGTLPLEIGKLINLQELDFSENKLSGEIPSILGNCLRLELLHLEGNVFQGSIPPSLGSLKGIVDLDLSRNNLSGSIPIELETLSFLQYLNLSFNNLQGEVPSKGVFRNTSAMSIVGNRNLCGGIPDLHLPACPIHESKNPRDRLGLKLIIIIASVVLCLLLLALSIVLWKKRKPRKLSSPQISLGEEFLRVSYDELLKATDGFSSSNLIGAGCFGSVYKGILHQDEKPVAVKVLNLEQLGATKSFIGECEALRKARHRNLLKIITACSSINFQGDDFKALVFEFMPCGSLESWLQPSEDMLPQTRALNLSQRLNIAIDVVSALNYLHHHCQTPIVHCDLKPSNVLLDEDMTACVGDFGLARFLAISQGSKGPTNSIAIKGSIGYVAPEYGMGGAVSTQGDVYSYGILLLEMLTGKRPTDDMFKDGLSLHNYSKMALPERVMEIVDPILLLEEEPNEATRNAENHRYMKAKMKECLISLIRIGVACSAETPGERMDISNVLMELNIIKEVFLGVGIHGVRRPRMHLAGEGTSRLNNF